MDEDWQVLTGFLPEGWEGLAEASGALKGLRKDKSAENLLRVLLLHVGCGYSLREAVVRAREAGLAELSDVALMKRLRKSRDWLHGMCEAMFGERCAGPPEAPGGRRVRAFDATTVREPGRTGSTWRVHYSVCLPSLACDHFVVTGASGAGASESLSNFPVREGDLVLADRGYSLGGGVAHVEDAGGHVTVRVNTGSLKLVDAGGGAFDLAGAARSLGAAGEAGCWPVSMLAGAGRRVPGRLCAMRKSAAAERRSRRAARRAAGRQGRRIKPETLEYAGLVLLFTTFPAGEFGVRDVLEWYRLGWQVELVFKRFKSLARLGHLPKRDPESSMAWLYGKLLTALLTERLVAHARDISPWGYELPRPPG